MIVLDASVVIAWADDGDALHEQAVRLLDAHLEEPLAMSVVSQAEFLVGPVRAGTAEIARRRHAGLGVLTLPLGIDADLPLASLRATTRLRLPDCCVLLAAEQNEAMLATFDDRLAAVAAGRGVIVLPSRDEGDIHPR